MRKQREIPEYDYQRILEAKAASKVVGDKVWGKGLVETTVTAVDGEILTLATGERAHYSRVRKV